MRPTSKFQRCFTGSVSKEDRRNEKQKEKYENAKEKLMEMGKIYNELKVNN